MKKINSLLAVAFTALSFVTVSCATTESASIMGESASASGTSLGAQPVYPSKLGDFDPVSLPEIMALNYSFNKLKVSELSKNYLIPRTNKVEIYFRDTVNSICVILPEASRHAIIDAANQFLDELEAETIKDEKPTAKNAYASMKCDFWWGVLNYSSNGAEGAVLYANSKVIEDKPYFVLRFPSSKGLSETKKVEYSPYTEIYFSPSQLRDLCDILDQSFLEGVIQEKIDKAFTY